MSIKTRARSFIAARNGNPLAAGLARVAEQYLNAYNNIANWDMGHNGEMRALRLVLGALDGDVIDVGANEGQWATAVLPFLAGNRLHSFEPVPDIFARLHARLGATAGVTLVNAGLGARDETITINFDRGVSTISSAFPLIYEGLAARPVACRITTGDAYLAEARIAVLSLLKIDVEGMEAACLDGFDRAFAERRVGAVQFEHGPSHVHSGHTLKHFVEWFGARGFALFEIFPKQLRPLRYDILRERFAGQNFLALREDLVARVLAGTPAS